MSAMSTSSPQPEQKFPMFEAGSGAAKGLIEAMIFKIIGVERNAKINAKSSKKKK